MQALNKFKNWYRDLPEKKKYLEFFTALLTVPMLVTVVLVNLNNLSLAKKAQQAIPTTSPTISEVVVTPTVDPNATIVEQRQLTVTPVVTNTPNPTVQAVCKKQLGPVNIISPDDNEVITKDPVNIDISYNMDIYCAVVWSYRIDNGSWSEYTDKAISLFNLTPGDKLLEVKIKSIASGEETVLKKKFTYQVNLPTPTTTPTVSTASASLQ
jgi:hypothetical protein